MVTVFNRLEEARDLASATQASHDDNADVQLGLGGWYEQQGESAKSEACFQRAVEIAPDYPPCRRIVAIDQLGAGKPKEAKTILADFRAPSEYYEPALFIMLARAFQAQAMYAEALEEYEEVTQNVPELAKDRTIRKEIKRCKKELKR